MERLNVTVGLVDALPFEMIELLLLFLANCNAASMLAADAEPLPSCNNWCTCPAVNRFRRLKTHHRQSRTVKLDFLCQAFHFAVRVCVLVGTSLDECEKCVGETQTSVKFLLNRERFRIIRK